MPLMVWGGGFSANGATETAKSGGGGGSVNGIWPAAVSCVTWSDHRPAVFFVLDATGSLHAFDVLEDDAGPVASAPCPPAAATAAAAAAEADQRLPPARTEVNPPALEALPPAAAPAFALSSENLATGSRPKAALAFEGRIYTRTLAGRMFRQPLPRPTVAGDRGRGGIDTGAASERERMEEWLGGVLWG